MFELIQHFDQASIDFLVKAATATHLLIIFKGIAILGVYLVCLALFLFWWFREDERRNLWGATMAGLVNWQFISSQLGMLINRSRPEIASVTQSEVLFVRHNYSFPSDHASFLLGIAFYLYFKKSIFAPFFFWLAVLVVISRAVIGLHFLTDVLAGAALAAGFSWLCSKSELFEKAIDWMVGIWEKLEKNQNRNQ